MFFKHTEDNRPRRTSLPPPVIMDIPIPVVHRQHFFLDPVFSECWNLLDRQKNSTFTTKVKVDEEEGQKGNVDLGAVSVPLPWKWNNMAKMAEYFGRSRPDMQISSDVEVCPSSYKILLDAQHFMPHELAISLTERTISIKGKHEEREDSHGPVKREFKRKYVIPSDVIMEKIQCNLSCDGIIHIVAPREGQGDEEDAKPESQSQGQPLPLPDIVEYPLMNSEPDAETKTSQPENSETEEPSIFENFIKKMLPVWNKGMDHPDKKFGNKSNKLTFKIVLDVGPYSKDDLVVHSTRDHVIVEGSHDEKQDEHGCIERKFTRCFDLPRNVNAEDLKCELTRSGVLEISGPRSQFNTAEGTEEERQYLPIQARTSISEQNEMMREITKDTEAICEEKSIPIPNAY